MGLPSINTREDLDAIAGTPEHVAFMALLAGTLWRLEKDDTAQAWVANPCRVWRYAYLPGCYRELCAIRRKQRTVDDADL